MQDKPSRSGCFYSVSLQWFYCLQPHRSQGCSGQHLSAPSSHSLGVWEGQGGIYSPLCFCGAGLGSRHRGSAQMWVVSSHSINLME